MATGGWTAPAEGSDVASSLATLEARCASAVSWSVGRNQRSVPVIRRGSAVFIWGAETAAMPADARAMPNWLSYQAARAWRNAQFSQHTRVDRKGCNRHSEDTRHRSSQHGVSRQLASKCAVGTCRFALDRLRDRYSALKLVNWLSGSVRSSSCLVMLNSSAAALTLQAPFAARAEWGRLHTPYWLCTTSRLLGDPLGDRGRRVGEEQSRSEGYSHERWATLVAVCRGYETN